MRILVVHIDDMRLRYTQRNKTIIYTNLEKKFVYMKITNLDYNINFPIVLEPNRIPFGAKSTVKV